MIAKLTPYITLPGNTREALRFYEEALGAETMHLLKYGDLPDFTANGDLKELVAHAMVRIGDAELMFSDTVGSPVQSGNQVTICITSTDAETSKRVFDALRRDGQVNMELQETSYSPAFADVTDKFGVTFQIFTEQRS